MKKEITVTFPAMEEDAGTQLLVLDDYDKVAILASHKDLKFIIEALDCVPRRFRRARKNLLNGLKELRRQAFGE